MAPLKAALKTWIKEHISETKPSIFHINTWSLRILKDWRGKGDFLYQELTLGNFFDMEL